MTKVTKRWKDFSKDELTILYSGLVNGFPFKKLAKEAKNLEKQIMEELEFRAGIIHTSIKGNDGK